MMMKIVLVVQIVCGRARRQAGGGERTRGGSSVRRARMSGGSRAAGLVCGGRCSGGCRTVRQITCLSGHNGN